MSDLSSNAPPKSTFLRFFDLKTQIHKLKNISLGLVLCIVITLTAKIFSTFYAVPVMVVALLIGLVLHYITAKKESLKSGIHFTARHVLKLGVVLLGARIAFSDITDLGFNTVAITIFTSIAVIGISMLCAKLAGAEKSLGILIGGATAICGASAAIALSTVMPRSKNLENNTLFAVIGATAIGTIAMIIYPFIMSVTDFTSHESGVLIGGTIHDVSQVVGAGYSISSETGDTAILIKLTRVFMLGPIILAFMFLNRGQKQSSEKPEFPIFLIWFSALVILNSYHFIPTEWVSFLSQASKWLLVTGIAAMGVKTSLDKLFSLGWKPLILILIDTSVISAIYYSVVLLHWI